MTTPVLREVRSSYLKKTGYDAQRNTLYVEFPSGKVWRYRNVTLDQYEAMLDADSIGKWFIANIKKNPEDHPGEPVG